MLYLTFLAVAIHLEPPPLLTIKLIKKVRRESEDSNLFHLMPTVWAALRISQRSCPPVRSHFFTSSNYPFQANRFPKSFESIRFIV